MRYTTNKILNCMNTLLNNNFTQIKLINLKFDNSKKIKK